MQCQRQLSSHQKKQENTLMSPIIHSENGILKVKSKLSELENTEDIKSKQILPPQNLLLKKKSVMQEYRPSIKKKIWKDKLTSLNQNTPNTELLKILALDSISKEKVLIPFWNYLSEEISKKLSLPIKTDYVDSDLNFSNQSLESTMGKSWFSMTKTKVQIKNSQRMSLASSQYFPRNYTGGEVIEIKELKNKTYSVTDKEPIEYKTLKFKLFPTQDHKEILFDMSNQQRSMWNACVNIFEQENSIDAIKEKIDFERTEKKVYKEKLKNIMEIKDKKLKKQKLKEASENKPIQENFNINYKSFRDNVRKYKYIETPFGETTDGNPIVLSEYLYGENNDSFPVVEFENSKINHNRIPRGAIHNFSSSFNSCISNYRNNELNFSLKYKTKKDINHTIYFEDASYPSIINNIRNKYCYTKVVDGKKKRQYISLSEMKEHLKIKSFTIVNERNTGQYYLNLSVPVDFLLPYDKRSENQALFKTRKDIISLDPGIRTFLAGYTLDETLMFGDGCSIKIFELLEYCYSLEILEIMTDKEKKDIYDKKKLLRKRIKDMVTDLHWKVIKYLTSTFQIIIYPNFETSNMMKKLSKENKRKLSTLSFYTFKQRLINKCKELKNTLIITNESYTSRTCCSCGYLNNPSTNKVFNCKKCKYTVDRDINGSRNIMIKTLGMLYMLRKDDN